MFQQAEDVEPSAAGTRPDSDLVEAVQAGSVEAFAELYRRHYAPVRRATQAWLRNPSDADEVAQAAFLRAFERIVQCGGDRRFGPWVLVIARRLALDLMRARARMQAEPLAAAVEPAGRRPVGPEEAVLHREAFRGVAAALRDLSSRQRDAVMARAIDERAPSEIAADLGLSTGAVDSLLLRARRRLAKSYPPPA